MCVCARALVSFDHVINGELYDQCDIPFTCFTGKKCKESVYLFFWETDGSGLTLKESVTSYVIREKKGCMMYNCEVLRNAYKIYGRNETFMTFVFY